MPLIWIANPPNLEREGCGDGLQRSRVKITRNLLPDIAIVTYCYGTFTFLEPVIGIELESMGIRGMGIGLVVSGITLLYFDQFPVGVCCTV